MRYSSVKTFLVFNPFLGSSNFVLQVLPGGLDSTVYAYTYCENSYCSPPKFVEFLLNEKTYEVETPALHTLSVVISFQF